MKRKVLSAAAVGLAVVILLAFEAGAGSACSLAAVALRALCTRPAAAALAGRFAPSWRLSARDVATAVVGGLLMGYGARLANGCNIGALLGGVVSGSLHGWWWLLWGFLGSMAGTWARERIGLDPPLLLRPALAESI